ncbi:hypothetical protein AB0G95_21740 [Streptomyces virginiae]|uniref:hypothetical protein n=1 Tax=Streptomyces virginiae TaxID=1961 RepID=UPI00344467C7
MTGQAPPPPSYPPHVPAPDPVEPVWYSLATTASTDAEMHEQWDHLRTGVEEMTAAAHRMADAAVPTAQPAAGAWDFSWILRLARSPWGRRTIVASVSSGPLMSAALIRYADDTGDLGGQGLLALALIATSLLHLIQGSWLTRWLWLGVLTCPITYLPALAAIGAIATGVTP